MIRADILDLDPDEIVLHQVKKHPIGLLSIYFVTTFLMIVNFGLLFGAIRYHETLGFGDYSALLTAVFTLSALLLLAAGLIARYIYKTNELIITNENVIQILQSGLFTRKVSQLSLAKIQDVSADQDGVFPSMFNYGVINIETAGEAANYNFTFAPDPNITSKYIIEAYEQFIKAQGGGATNPVNPNNPGASF